MRLIDADALIANKFKNDISYNAFVNLVKRQETVDVIPVKHGKWFHYEGTIICSECKAAYYDDILEYTGDDVPRYCLNCGARMDGDPDA